MARKHKHEEHLNAEAWAIPYGDLVTLLLALFVVMYAMSSVNEGKYRVMSEALSEAFHGSPRSMKPIQIGEKTERGMGSSSKVDLTHAPPKDTSIGGLYRDLKNPQVIAGEIKTAMPSPQTMASGNSGYRDGGKQSLTQIAHQVEKAMRGLIQENLIVVRRKATYLEIEIKTDILFPPGVAQVSLDAMPVLSRLGGILSPFDNPLRVEGHTDNMPIATATFPSNWELSTARAASVLHVLLQNGVPPERLSLGGYGEFHPVADNATAEGRNANRRVVLVVLAGTGDGGAPLESVLGAQAEPAPGSSTQALNQSPAALPGPLSDMPLPPPPADALQTIFDSSTVRLAP